MLAQFLAFCVRQLGTVRAQDLLLVSDEALANKILATVWSIAVEALVMPMTSIERDEFRAADASDGFAACCASFGEQFSETVGTVRLVITRSELLPNQVVLAVGASKTVPVVGFVSVQNTTRHNRLGTGFALGSEEVIETLDAVLLVILGHETVAADFRSTVCALETLLVPLLTIPLQLLHASFEHLTATVALSSKLLVIAVVTKESIVSGAKEAIHQ